MFVCHCTTFRGPEATSAVVDVLLSMTSMSRDLSDRESNDLARIKRNYFKGVFTFVKFSVKKDQHQSLTGESEESHFSLSLASFLDYHDAGPCVTIARRLARRPPLVLAKLWLVLDVKNRMTVSSGCTLFLL